MHSFRIAIILAALLGPGLHAAPAQEILKVGEAEQQPAASEQACEGENCVTPQVPAVSCAGENCLPPADNPVLECKGEGCTMEPLGQGN